MNKFTRTSITFLCCLLLFVNNVIAAENVSAPANSQESDDFKWADYKKTWMDDIQIHGFFSQGLFSTSGNNVYGKSKDSVSAGLTELGLNISYHALNNLSFAVQGLYRRAGESTGPEGTVSLDFAFVDYTFFRHQAGRFGVRAGRVKNPWGLYNETRDVASTHPTIFLPLAYFDRSRALFVSLNGGQFYSDYNTNIGDFSFKLNLGLTNPNNKELLMGITNNPNTLGNLTSDLSLVTSLNYEIDNGKYIFAFSYANLSLGYDGEALDPYIDLNSKINSFMLSAQYNGERLSLTAEYALQWNQFNQLPTPFPGIKVDVSPVSEHWYVQAGYRILDNLQAMLRYDSSVRDINDRKGITFNKMTSLPANIVFTQDIVFGMRWDISPAWMLRAEYHRVHGSNAVSAFDNPNLSLQVKDWNIYALQLAYRF